MEKMNKGFLKKIGLLGSFLTALIVWGCGSGGSVNLNSAEEVYKRAVLEFEDEDWLEAQKYFDIIKLQYPASAYADDAQYYIAQIHFEKEEFILAAYNYNSLRRVFPGSEYAKAALYKSALSFLELSPTYDRDQEYTKKAIQTFSEFQALYPKDSLYGKASKNIQDLRNKLAQGDYSKAVLYLKMSSPHSAIIYFDAVIENYPDTEFFEPAYFGKIQSLIQMEKFDEADSIIKLFKQLFPKSDRLSEVEIMEQSLP